MPNPTQPYLKTLLAGWGDMDFNGHMRNTAYLDKSADVRMMFFAEHGFSMSEFMRLKIGPVVMKDEIEYQREGKLCARITSAVTARVTTVLATASHGPSSLEPADPSIVAGSVVFTPSAPT